MKITLAIPTNGQRHDQLDKTIQAWVSQTAEPIEIFVTTAGDTWAAGLNDAWRAHPDSDIFIAGSDDMYPEGEWLPMVEQALREGFSPVPLMKDPRFLIQGGVIASEERPDRSESHMTNFPVLKGEWLSSVFPIEQLWCPQHQQHEDLHYCSDDLISDRLHDIGVKTVYVKDFVIVHTWDERGRGAGMGSEDVRLSHDRVIYKTHRKSVGLHNS